MGDGTVAQLPRPPRLAGDRRIAAAEVLEAEGRRDEAEKRYHTLAADVALPASLRVRATARLAGLLLDRNDHGGAFTVADRAVAELGPHPDLLDARASARAGTGNVAGAISDFTDAVLVPTPTRLLHLAYGEARAEDFRGAMAALEQAVEAGLDAPNLRPMDRQCLDDIVQRLGLSRVPAGSP